VTTAEIELWLRSVDDEPAVSSNPVVLVVDDDRDIRESLRELLAETGYQVATAENGRSALDQLRAGLRPGVILLDLMMPVMDGMAFRSEQLADPALCTLPVVLITAAGRPATDALRSVTVLHKPLRMRQVLTAVNQHCRPGEPNPDDTPLPRN
jgi:CheY-like chemotaxis protein